MTENGNFKPLEHEFEKYPMGSSKRLFLVYKEWIGIDVMADKENK
jgi:hypothetical protein